MIVSSSWDKLTLATEEGTKLVCSSLFFLAFYKDRYKNRHGKIWRLFTWELSVRVCQDEWVRVCVLQDKRGEELLLVRPRTTYWASRTSSERAGTREASRSWQRNHQGRSAGKQSIPCLKSNQIITGRTTCTNAYNILIWFTLKRRGLFKDGVYSDQSLVWAE